jgi:hypothetical protein
MLLSDFFPIAFGEVQVNDVRRRDPKDFALMEGDSEKTGRGVDRS